MHAPVKGTLQENGCSYNCQTLTSYAVNIYYQINSKKYIILIFSRFQVDAPLRAVLHESHKHGQMLVTNLCAI